MASGRTSGQGEEHPYPSQKLRGGAAKKLSSMPAKEATTVYG